VRRHDDGSHYTLGPLQVLDAIQRKNKRHDLKVAYEIILDTKQAKLRTQEIQRLFTVRQIYRLRITISLASVLWLTY